jgi:hypothetical protein
MGALKPKLSMLFAMAQIWPDHGFSDCVDPERGQRLVKTKAWSV